MGIWEKCKAPCSYCQGLISYQVHTLPYIREGTSLAQKPVSRSLAQPVGLTCFHFEIMARNPGSTKPTPASCCLQATEHCREELRVTELGMSSPFLANTIPGNARDEHQEWPEGAAPAPAAAQVLSLGLPLSALHCSCTQQITQDFSMH